MTTISSFINRLKKIGVIVELDGNYPWVYLRKVNGVYIKEKFESEHYFTVFFRATKPGGKDTITDISKIFKVIREALCKKEKQ